MDPLSITASTIAIITLVTASLKGLDRLHAAPGEIESILNDLVDTQVILKSIDDGLLQYKNGPRCDQRQYDELGTKLLVAHAIVKELRNSIAPHYIRSNGRTVGARVAWLKMKGKAQKLRDKVNSIRAEISRIQGSFERASIYLELQHVSLLSAETNARNQALLSNSFSIDTRLEQVTQHQHRQMAELAALKKSQEHLLRLLEPSWKGLQHVVTGTKQLQSPLNSQDAILPLHFSRSSSYDTVVLTTTYRSTQTCEPTCCCACHSHVKIEMAGFLQQALGRLFVGYSGIPLLMGSCNVSTCKRQAGSSWYSQYYFPKWYLQQSILPHFAILVSIKPNKMTLEVPRVIDGDSTIFQIALAGDLNALRTAFAHRAASPTDINGKTGRTLLHYAFVRKYNPAVVRLLLEQGTNPYIRDHTGWQVTNTIWELRFSSNDRYLFGDIFSSELPVERGFTELHLTVLKIRHNDLSTVLRQSPSFVNSVDSTGRTALAWAAHREDSYAVKKLLDYGADSSLGDQCGVVPLHLAAENRTVKCLEVLLAQDADVDQMDIHGRTAAHYACEYQSPVDGETEAMLRILRDRGADILRADRYGRTGLHKSAAVGNVGGLVFFLHHGCDKDKLDDWGKSALVDTIKRNQHKALAELLKYDSGRFEGLGVNNDHTLLHILADDADLQTLQMVYRARLAGINTRKLDGQSRAAQDIFDNRVPPPEPDLTETWYMLLMQLEGDDLTDGTSSEKSWIYEDALEEQHTIISEAKRVYGLEHV